MRFARLAPLVLIGGAFAQVALEQTTVTAPPVVSLSRIYAYYQLPGTTTSALAWITLAAPLALAIDATTGRPQISINGPLNINLLPAKVARNEVPAATFSGWTIAHTPLAGVTCWRNGLHQSPGLDYTLAGPLLTSAFWQPDDTLACDYEW